MKRRLPLVGYIILTIAVAYTIASGQSQAADSRAQLAAATKHAYVVECERSNELRTQLQKIILSGIPQTKRLAAEGTITKAQADRAVRYSQDAATKLSPVDCRNQASGISQE